MNYIGNDIVDLNSFSYKEIAHSQRALDKLFTPSEQKTIHSSDLPGYMLWVLWCCKESAYKTYYKQTEQRMYRPLLFEVIPSSITLTPYINKIKERKIVSIKSARKYLTGKVNTPIGEVLINILLTPTFVHGFSYLKKEDCKDSIWEVNKIEDSSPKNQSAQVRKMAIHRIAKKYDLEVEKLAILRSNINGKLSPPALYQEGEINLQFDVSLSHEGCYVAYAFRKKV